MSRIRLHIVFVHCFVLFISLLVIAACKKTEIIDYAIKSPIVLQTKPVEVVDINKLKLSGKVDKLNEETILDVGFVLYDRSAESQSPIEISLPNVGSISAGDFTYIYSSPTNFIFRTPYAYCFYIKTNKALYKGEIIEFTVDLIKVDESPVIKSKIGEPLILKGDFAQIDGTHFITSDIGNQRIITIPYTLSKDKKELKLNIPYESLTHGQQLDLIINYRSKNGLNHFSRKLVSISLIALIKEPTETQYYYNDILPIEGLGVHTPHEEKLKIIINGISIPYHSGLRFSDFGNYNDLTFKWAVDYGNEIVEFKNPITLKSPSADNLQIENRIIHTSQIFSLKGLNFKSFYNNEVEISLNDIPVDYTIISDNILNINSNTLPHGEYTLTLKSPLYTIAAKSKIIIKPLNVTGLSHSTVFVNDKLRILGDFIIGQNYHLRFSDMESTWLTASSTSALEVVIPYLAEDKYTLKLSWQKYNGEIIDLDYQHTLHVKEAEVHAITPKTFNAGETIRVTGNGLFDIMGIYLDNYTILAEQVTQNSVTFKVPYNFSPGKFNVSFLRKWRRDLKTEQTIEIK